MKRACVAGRLTFLLADHVLESVVGWVGLQLVAVRGVREVVQHGGDGGSVKAGGQGVPFVGGANLHHGQTGQLVGQAEGGNGTLSLS